jgi:hypothetical protein
MAPRPVQAPRTQKRQNIQDQVWYQDDADLQRRVFDRALRRREANRTPRELVDLNNLPANTFIGDGDCPICTNPLNGMAYPFPCGHVVCQECRQRSPTCPFNCSNHHHDHE